MIRESNLKILLSSIGYIKNGTSYIRDYPEYSCQMEVDFANKKLIYPSLIIGGDRNTGFDAPENFVVFECVTRLLNKGYRPEHIELEKTWMLGHEQKGGRADICVYSKDKSFMLFIIECKTFGKEYSSAYKDLLADGGQLFSYWQQERSTKWLALYASDILDDGSVVYNCPVINCSDDENIKVLAKKDDSVKLFEKAYTAETKYNVWKETYLFKQYDNLIFSNDTVAYDIGVKPILKRDLKDFTPEDKIVNRFEEILRHNNVSDKENAFNRLVALFICKLVDEIKKGDDDVVDFQYKQGTDTYESLQDRLQRLHKEGMENFMKEEIFYVENDYAEKLFSQYIGQKRKNAISELNKTIRILKFYSNNDFAFKDVHNEELFLQNGKILVEVVQLFEKYRIVYPSKHQFLGDLFENLLNKGFKQNEGQFFTPMPITRFIWDCLPLKKIINKDDTNSYPKTIDYACGAGHFLTEGVESINAYYRDQLGIISDNSWTRDYIFGVEKDYRLARVSKVSMFMNGAGESNIIFGDGLENYNDKNISPSTFDILVANPPYSVSGFKNHLNLKNNAFNIIDTVSNDGSEIETLFIERILQLVKPNGIAAVVLPSTILTKNINSYIYARRLLLSNFKIKGITSFGKSTFGATSTSTVVLFLQKFDEPPARKLLVADSVNNILNNILLDNDSEDVTILNEFLKIIGVQKECFNHLILEDVDINYWESIDFFNDYYEEFLLAKEYLNKISQKSFKKLSKSEQDVIIKSMFYTHIKALLFDKLEIFAMVYKQKTIVITSPEDNKEQKRFLGYEWSNRKGSEGIVITNPGGKLYNESDRYDDDTLAGLIRNSFDDKYYDVENRIDFYRCSELKEMIDFNRVAFNLEINTNIKDKIEYKEGINTDLLQNLIIEQPKSTIQVNEAEDNFTGSYPFFTSGEAVYKYDSNLVDGENIYLSTGGTASVKFYDGKASYSTDTWAIKSSDESKISTKFLFYILESLKLTIKKDYFKGQGLKHLQKEDLKASIKLPLLDTTAQNEIVTKCAAIDKKYDSKKSEIEKLENEIKDLFIKTKPYERTTIKFKSSDFDISLGKRVLRKNLVEDGVPVFSANVKEVFGFVDNELLNDYSTPSIVWGIDGDWVVNFMEPNFKFYPTDHCGVLRVNNDNINPLYLMYKLESLGVGEGFNRVNRPSVDRIKALVAIIPDKSTQDEFASKASMIRKQINKIKKELLHSFDEKKALLDSYLK